jgi:hypothetical protein
VWRWEGIKNYFEVLALKAQHINTLSKLHYVLSKNASALKMHLNSDANFRHYCK